MKQLVVKNPMQGFVDFLRERAVAGLAIGFVLGSSVSALVTSFTNDIVNPVIGVVLGSVGNLKDQSVPFAGRAILWGDFVYALINFIVLTLVIFLTFSLLGLHHLDKKKE